MTHCMYCRQESPAGHYDRIVENITPLYGPWAGWRMAGRDLVSPDRQRINPQRLQGLLFLQAAEARLAKIKIQNQAAALTDRLIPMRERFEGCA